MPIAPCPTFTVATSDFVGGSTSGGFANLVPTPSAPPGTAFIATLRFEGTATLPAGFTSGIWLASGPGPTYTRENQLVLLNGTIASGTQVSGTLPATTVMPNAGRVWNYATDAIQVAYSGLTANLTGTQFTLFNQVCSGSASVADCCAELNAKLDEVLAMVGKVYANQP
jgi:hypothetical protein